MSVRAEYINLARVLGVSSSHTHLLLRRDWDDSKARKHATMCALSGLKKQAVIERMTKKSFGKFAQYGKFYPWVWMFRPSGVESVGPW